MPILADVAAGPVFVIVGVLAGALILLVIAVVETAVLVLLHWGSIWRSFVDALLINVASALVGVVLYYVGTPQQVAGGYDPRQGGRLYDTRPPIIPTPLAFVLAWALSVAIEGGVLLLLKRHPRAQTWRAAVAINVVSYLVFGLLIVLGMI